MSSFLYLDIKVKENGIGGVDLQDNGSGIRPEDYENLTRRFVFGPEASYSHLISLL